jgi:hypothetical protein
MTNNWRNFNEFISRVNERELKRFVEFDPEVSNGEVSIIVDRTCQGRNYWECERCFNYRGFHADGQHYYKKTPIMVKCMISHRPGLSRNDKQLGKIQQIVERSRAFDNRNVVIKHLVVGDPFSILYSFYLGLLPRFNPLVADFHFNQVYCGYVCGIKGKILGTHVGSPLRSVLEQAEQTPIPSRAPNPVSLLSQFAIICAEFNKHGVIVTHPNINDLLLYEREIAYRYGNITVETNDGLIINHNTITCFNLNNARFMVDVEVPNTESVLYRKRVLSGKLESVPTMVFTDSVNFVKMVKAGVPIHPCFNFYVYYTWLFSYQVWRRDIETSERLRALNMKIWSPEHYEKIIRQIVSTPPQSLEDICNILRGVDMRCDVIDLVLTELGK